MLFKVSAVVNAVRIHAVVSNAVNVAIVLPAVLDEGELVRLMHTVVAVPQDSRVITLCKSAKSSKEFGANIFAGATVSVQVGLEQIDTNLDCGLGHKVLKFLIHGVIPSWFMFCVVSHHQARSNQLRTTPFPGFRD